jgi:hypothetical protein
MITKESTVPLPVRLKFRQDLETKLGATERNRTEVIQKTKEKVEEHLQRVERTHQDKEVQYEASRVAAECALAAKLAKVGASALCRRSGMGWVKNQDPDPGSAFGMNIPDHISKSLETIFLVKNTYRKFFDANPDPRSEIFLTLDPGRKIRIRDPE